MQLEDKRGTRLKRIHKRLNKKLPSRKKLGITAVEPQIRAVDMHQLSGTTDHHHNRDQRTLMSFIQKHPHPSSVSIPLTSNKCLRKLDWFLSLTQTCVGGYTLSLLLVLVMVMVTAMVMAMAIETAMVNGDSKGNCDGNGNGNSNSNGNGDGEGKGNFRTAIGQR